MNEIIEFKVQSKNNPDIEITGYVDVEEIDDEAPLYFYNQQGVEAGHYVPANPFNEENENWDEYEKISSAFQSDELFLQFLSDFSDENKTVDRGDYLLKINDGAELELDVETDYDPNDFSFGDRNFYALMSFKYNGKPIEWNEDILEELAEDIDSTYAGEGRYKIISDETIEIEIFDGFDEELDEYVGLSGKNEESRRLIKEHIQDCERAFKKQLIINLEVFSIAYSYYSEYLDSERDEKRFDEAYKQDWATSVEESFESYSIKELYFMTEDDVEKIIKEDHDEELQLREDAQREYELEQKELEEELKREFSD